ncbi:protein TIPIN homolog [Teleopsis dalmanni]|uniref:protein TIPIN homolog n=1 Tax=Teleopsis dalmanni TaxID=139649 RepID=UPI0018CD2198|nr:protein TIPIN homolog [Teleopsis dalmanni]
MASIFGDDGVEDLFNENINAQDLPSDDEQRAEGDENIFGDNAEGVDGEGQPIKLEPKKRSVRNPRVKLSIETLQGPRGIHTIEDYFKDIKYKGKGHERDDLNEVVRRMQHWAHRMYPNYKFNDVLNNIERLGKKKTLQVHMSRYRLGMLENLDVNPNAEIINPNEEEEDEAIVEEPFDEFDALLGEQIALSRVAPRTPGPSAHKTPKTPMTNSTLHTPSFARNAVMSTPHTNINLDDTSEYAQPLPASQPATPVAVKTLTAEQMARIAENRRLAQERLRARQQQQQQAQKQAESEKLATVMETEELNV